MATRTRTIIIGEAGPDLVTKPITDWFLVDTDAVPLCQSWAGCQRQAVWSIRKRCKCQLMFCEPCRVAHWQFLLEEEYEARRDIEVTLLTVECKACGRLSFLDPSLPLYPQLVLEVILL